MALTFNEKCFFAKKTSLLDLDTPEGSHKFYELAQKSGLGGKWLAYYANAYEAAGESGMRALSCRKRLSEEVRDEAMEKIEKYLNNKIPVQLRKEIGFLVKAQFNRITVSEKRPLFNNPLRTSCIEVFQVRYTDFDQRWHLYWMRKFNKWWPYVPQQPVYTIDDCLREVRSDAWGCFWG